MGREFRVSKYRENNGIKEYRIGIGWATDEEMQFARENGFEIESMERMIGK